MPALPRVANRLAGSLSMHAWPRVANRLAGSLSMHAWPRVANQVAGPRSLSAGSSGGLAEHGRAPEHGSDELTERGRGANGSAASSPRCAAHRTEPRAHALHRGANGAAGPRAAPRANATGGPTRCVACERDQRSPRCAERRTEPRARALRRVRTRPALTALRRAANGAAGPRIAPRDERDQRAHALRRVANGVVGSLSAAARGEARGSA
jgi:hypothetical protein